MQLLPKLTYNSTTSEVQPGGFIDIIFKPATHGDQAPPSLNKGDNINAVFFHALWNWTVPIIVDDPTVLRAQIPNITSWSGELIVALTFNTTIEQAEDVIAGPLQIELDSPLLISLSWATRVFSRVQVVGNICFWDFTNAISLNYIFPLFSCVTLDN